MLKIRPEHIAALAVQQTDSFAERMMLHLREIFPAETSPLSDGDLRLFVEAVCDDAGSWGIDEESLVERLIELFISFEELWSPPAPGWMMEIGCDPERSPGEKVRVFEDRLLFGAVEDAR